MPKSIVTIAEMHAMEVRAAAAGLSHAQMMTNAGEAAAAVVAEELANRLSMQLAFGSSNVLLLCGAGNNGGDGLICARALCELHQHPAAHMQVFSFGARSDQDAHVNALRTLGVSILRDTDSRLDASLRKAAENADVVVDALLGTGTSRPIAGNLARVLHTVRAAMAASSKRPMMVALDGPTGMNFDTGALDPAASPSDLTITFHAPKRGHFCYPAAGARGELRVAQIGISDSGVAVVLADGALVRDLLPARRPDANKGTHGRALVIGGSRNFIGAPALAAMAAYRAGAGLVTIATTGDVRHAVSVLAKEATFESADEALIDLSRYRALLIGPGLGLAAAATRIFDQLAQKLTAANGGNPGCVFDADSLTMISRRTMEEIQSITASTQAVFTPHPGEMARLMHTDIAMVQADRIEHALRAAAQFGATVVLKGAHTIVANPDGRAAVLPFANPALATAGTGDVLAGAITGLMAQGMRAFDGAVCGAYLHAAAGELWRARNGDAGLLAGDLLDLLPQARLKIIDHA